MSADPPPPQPPLEPDTNSQPDVGGEKHTSRTVRTFKSRADAEVAAALLEAEGIHATILDLAVTPGARNIRPGAVRVVVEADAATKATNILLRFDRDNKTDTELAERNRSRRYQPPPGPPAVARGLFSMMAGGFRGKGGRGIGPAAILFVLMAVVAAGMATFFVAKSRLTSRSRKPNGGQQPERIVNEDMNHDGKVDLRRYVSTRGLPIREEVDFNFDEKWDIRLTYENGGLVKRAVDHDNNGIYDEETYYDYLGQPFYGQVLANGKGAVTERRFYRGAEDFPDFVPPDEVVDPDGEPNERPEGGEFWPYKLLIDKDADGRFDIERELNLKGEAINERPLERNGPENEPPVFPAPPKQG